MPLPALAARGAGAVGQLSVTGLLARVLGSVPISTGGYRKWGSSKQRGIRIDSEIDNYVAYGTTPKLKETRAKIATTWHIEMCDQIAPRDIQGSSKTAFGFWLFSIDF